MPSAGVNKMKQDAGERWQGAEQHCVERPHGVRRRALFVYKQPVKDKSECEEEQRNHCRKYQSAREREASPKNPGQGCNEAEDWNVNPEQQVIGREVAARRHGRPG